jgi:transcriptional regulator with PAS, ATPase and Fis domain
MTILSEPTTATGDDDGARPGEPPVTALRWVHAIPSAVTVLCDGTTVIGRDASANVQLDSIQVSRVHAEISGARGIFGIEDRDSKNGIFVNGERRKSAQLRAGDVLRIGHAVGVMEVGAPGDLAGFEALGAGIFGGAAMRRVVRRAKTAALGTLNVLLQGETGTGKERVARAIHQWSGRGGKFLAVNCASYSEATMVAELVGYREGAFGSADKASLGHVRAAQGGTLLLDEISELSPDMQARLLRIIEQREVLPLGETEPLAVDVRFIAASQLPLSDVCAQGRFRPDLRARLEGLIIDLLPLRARRADIVPLFRELIRLHGGPDQPSLDYRSVEMLTLHDWSMNVRELENVARRTLSHHGGGAEISFDELADAMGTIAIESPGTDQRARRRNTPGYPTDEVEALLKAIEQHDGNLSKAAEELGMTRAKAYRILRAVKARR